MSSTGVEAADDGAGMVVLSKFFFLGVFYFADKEQKRVRAREKREKKELSNRLSFFSTLQTAKKNKKREKKKKSIAMSDGKLPASGSDGSLMGTLASWGGSAWAAASAAATSVSR